jgi:succinate dehydrogenase / fumarate reductase cytochrome b subunit
MGRRRLNEAARAAGESMMADQHVSRLKDRPLSPHLSIYSPMLSMVMSIVHRITGGALYFGMLLVAWWLMAVAAGPSDYAFFQWCMTSWLGLLVLFGMTWALLHHALGGIRHLIWDLRYGFEPAEREWLVRATLIGSVGLTLILWILGYMVMGAA